MSSTSAAPETNQRKALVAIDLGAESCRVSLLRWTPSQVRWPEAKPHITLVHRFANAPRQVGDGLYWSLDNIHSGVDEGLHRCAELASEGIRSIAVDGWAVDYVRLDREGQPLGDPFCYRDVRTVAAEASLHAHITPTRMRSLTAITPMRINTLYQQHADRLANLPAPGCWLNLPEYILFRFGGRPVSEQTNAAHTQLIDIDRRTWSEEIFKAGSLNLAAAPTLVEPGTDLGQLTGEFAQLPAFRDTRLIAPACHDTASAIAGIPAVGDDWAYISSGTWSLVGTLVATPIKSAEAAHDGFTNLTAAGGASCFHVNVNGMWILSQCIAQWKQSGQPHDIAQLVAAARQLPPPLALLNVDEPDLLLPGNMMQRINAQLTKRGLAPLAECSASAPAFASLIFHSLAARYRQVLARIETHTGKHLRRVFIVGGGSRNEYLNTLIAQVTGLEVHRGSPESSTIGNFAMQLAVLEGHSAPDAATISHWAGALQHAYTA